MYIKKKYLIHWRLFWTFPHVYVIIILSSILVSFIIRCSFYVLTFIVMTSRYNNSAIFEKYFINCETVSAQTLLRCSYFLLVALPIFLFFLVSITIQHYHNILSSTNMVSRHNDSAIFNKYLTNCETVTLWTFLMCFTFSWLQPLYLFCSLSRYDVITIYRAPSLLLYIVIRVCDTVIPHVFLSPLVAVLISFFGSLSPAPPPPPQPATLFLPCFISLTLSFSMQLYLRVMLPVSPPRMFWRSLQLADTLGSASISIPLSSAC